MNDKGTEKNKGYFGNLKLILERLNTIQKDIEVIKSEIFSMMDTPEQKKKNGCPKSKALAMLKEGISVPEISKALNMTVTEIELIKKLSKKKSG